MYFICPCKLKWKFSNDFAAEPNGDKNLMYQTFLSKHGDCHAFINKPMLLERGQIMSYWIKRQTTNKLKVF